ncbi:MAG: hypothetical protein SPL55_07525 [Prevotella sp.]|nr:hypothetical protein [Prevotella sp.]
MKNQITKIFALIVMGIFATTMVFAQGLGGHSHKTTAKDPKKGDDWEIIHFPKIDRNTGYAVVEGGKHVVYDRHYYTGGKFDNVTVDKFLGHHWKGHTIEEVAASGEQIYLCNVETGEYLQVGDYWGENTMTNHAGISYTLDATGATFARSTWGEFMNQDTNMNGYWICPVLQNSTKEGRCVGRMHKNDGIQGHFEHNRYLALRDKYEYDDNGAGENPGGFVFQFHSVTTNDGKQAYIIYTHRQTSSSQDVEAQEYWNRDSYLLLKSASKEKTGYHTVRFRKFAGQMYGKPTANFPVTTTWNSDRDIPLGDEKDFVGDNGTPKSDDFGALVDANKRVGRLAGLNQAAKDKNNLWKIVTKSERERFRLVASEDQPVDMTYRIKNSKFYTSYTYTRTLKESSSDPNDVVPNDYVDGTPHGHYTHANGERDFGWQWFDVDRETHYTNHHIHPWNQHKVGEGTWNPGWYDPEAQDTPRERELHKVGTGLYYRFNTPDVDRKQDEMFITQGLESNYVGSIWKGSTNLQQTIGTGKPGDPKLREGLYLVAVKGFYAPHDMMKYFKDEDDNKYKHWSVDFSSKKDTEDALTTGMPWYTEAVVTTDGPNKGKWKRSHDSYLFAWSYPEVVTRRKTATQADIDAGNAYYEGQSIPDEDPEEVRRMLPSIYEGAVLWEGADAVTADEKKILSKAYLLDDGNQDFLYTEVGYSLSGNRPGYEAGNEGWRKLTEGLKDEKNIAIYDGRHFSSSRYSGWNYGTGKWAVPKSLIGAGHWFNGMEGVDENSSPSYKNLSAYRIALPVYVGPEGILTIGVDHTLVNEEVPYTYQEVNEEGNPVGDPIDMTLPKSNPDEWVCFDDFELIYLGKVEPDEFVIDERHGNSDYKVEPRLLTDGSTGEPYAEGEEKHGQYSAEVVNKNNTQWNDIFSETDIALEGEKVHRVKTVVIRRTLKKGGYSSIVVPVDLTKAQVKEGFGENVRVSKLDDFTGRTIIYKALQDITGDDEILMEAGVPYIINPSKDPDVPAPTKVVNPDNSVSYNVEVTYDRPRFTLAYSTSAKDIAGYYLRDEERNYEVETSMAGPIYVISDVRIESERTFPDVNMVEDTPGYFRRKYRNGSDEPSADDIADNAVWKAIDAFDSVTKKSKTYGINRGELQGKKYKMLETAHYTAGEPIPAYSYLWADGKMYYTSEAISTSRGLFSYLQMVEVDDSGNPIMESDGVTPKVYAKPFISGADSFFEILVETNGIEDVNKRVEPDGNLEIYDLMGRKVTNPRPNNIYIMNGVKVLWK